MSMRTPHMRVFSRLFSKVIGSLRSAPNTAQGSQRAPIVQQSVSKYKLEGVTRISRASLDGLQYDIRQKKVRPNKSAQMRQLWTSESIGLLEPGSRRRT